MRHFRGGLLLASFLAGAPLLIASAMPAQAQFSASISFNSFHDTLSRDGDWFYSDRWGEVWRPLSQDRDDGWRPYWAGHWVPTREYGWTWISDEGDWGDITYHYGRWVYDPDDGWLWLPGYVWSPAWVVWRSSGPDVGWMPMPPDDDFLRPSGISIGIRFGDWNDIGGYYGYSRWYGSSFDQARFGRLWTFVPGARLSDPGYRRYALPRTQTINIVRSSRNITNYTVVNNVIINRSVNTTVINRGGRAPQPVAANTVLRNTRLVTRVDQGEQIQARARQERPHGNGQVNSAPPPTQEQIRTLSTRSIPTANARANAGGAPGNTENRGNDRGNDRGAPRHLFNQSNAQELQARSGGQQQPNAAPPSAQQPTAQQPAAPPQLGNDQRGPRNRDNSNRDNNGRGPERTQAPPATPPALAPPSPAEPPRPAPQAAPTAPGPNTPPTEDRGRGFDRGNDRNADRPPRALPRQPAPPPAMDQRPQTPPAREPMQREQPGREQPQRPMEQRAPDRSPPERAAPQAQPREQAPQQSRPNNPPQDRGQDRGRGRDRSDDNNR